ncbi:MAG: alpha/beta hydrolase [Silvanigrellaceae bacterium]|nr:alpha/beta hydrolase [Silvanigrellaceae bacterium]
MFTDNIVYKKEANENFIFKNKIFKYNTNERFLTDFEKFNKEVINSFYEIHGESQFFVTADQKKISSKVFTNVNAKAVVILVTGYNESFYKYDELIFDLWNENYSVFTYDHRGQGYSDRISTKNDAVYVDKFQDIIDDLAFFYHNTVLKSVSSDAPVFCLAHSMGGLILLSAVLQKKIAPKGIILASPMLKIALPIPTFLALMVARLMRFLGKGKDYAFAQKPCIPLLPFETNDVTHSLKRFIHWRNKISKNVEMQLGGPTFGWLAESIEATLWLDNFKAPINIPTIILQAQNDTVVENQAQNEFYTTQKILHSPVELLKYPRAKHELFLEIDEIRSQAIQDVINFIEQF